MADDNQGGDTGGDRQPGNEPRRERFYSRLIRRPTGGTLFLLIAAIIGFIIDNKIYYFSFLGDVYHGFSTSGLFRVDWLGLVTGGMFLGIIALFYFIRQFEGRGTFFGAAVVLAILSYVGGSIRWPLLNTIPGIYKYIAPALLVCLFLLIKALRQRFDFFDKEELSFMFLALVYTFFLTFTTWALDLKAVIHFVFISAFGFLYIRRNEQEEHSRWHILLAMFLLLDFFGTGYLERISWLRFIPFIVFGTAIYVNHAEPENRWAVLVLVIALLSIVAAQASASGYLGDFTFTKFKDYKNEADVKSIYQRVQDTIKKWTSERIELATGGLYRGSVEQNRYEQLGVYIDNVRAADPHFYITDEVTIWGTIKAKTLSQPSRVQFGCKRWLTDENQLNSEDADKITPDKPFTIFNLEENDFECIFEPLKLQSGSNTITLSATYNFETDAYQKAYFIDRGRYRSMLREKIDPFDNYGIDDKNPKTVFTNGPVEIGMNIQNLVAVVGKSGENNDNAQLNRDSTPITPYLTILGISLRNRGQVEEGGIIGGFEGRIKSIKELIILLPNGISISHPAEECNPVPFIRYTIENCKGTCQTENKACEENCKEEFGGDSKQCENACNDVNTECKENCNVLFASDNGNANANAIGYNGYQLDISKLNEVSDKNENFYKDIEKHRTFACKINPTAEILGSTPITTRYIRARAKYDYLHEKSISVDVEDNIGVYDSSGSSMVTVDDKVPPTLVLAVAYHESGFRHCCKDGGTGGRCRDLTTDTSCTRGSIITSNYIPKGDTKGCCIGMMQIYENFHLDRAKKNEVCGAKADIKELDCNVKVAVNFLEELYEKHKDGYLFSCQGTRNYRGWDAALRLYAGPKCDATHKNFVEEIKAIACCMQENKFPLDKVHTAMGSYLTEAQSKQFKDITINNCPEIKEKMKSYLERINLRDCTSA